MDRYALIEIMGHRVRVGRVSEVEKYGAVFCRVEPVDGDGNLGPPEDYSAAAIFAERTVTREDAIDMAKPYHRQRLFASAEYDEPDEPDEPEDGCEDEFVEEDPACHD